ALDRGAVGILTQGVEPAGDGAWLVAENPRQAAALLSARAWGRPSEQLNVVGITGTNGKTTTAHMLHGIWTASGRPAALLGTLGVKLPDGEFPQARTTPEAPELQETLARALAQGAEIAAMEVSSHSLDLHRVDGTRFAAVAFLNLAPEHLDWHGTMDAYGASKLRLFAELLAPGSAPAGPRAVVNGNDPWADRFRAVVEDSLVFATGGRDADVTAHGIKTGPEGTDFVLVTPAGEAEVTLPVPGRHNLENALAAAALAFVLGFDLHGIARGLSRFTPPAGRFECVHRGTFAAYVDYAHTPDGVEHALAAARAAAGAGRVIVVLGCGGDRDQIKRPVMGRVAAELSDHAVFTADNPRFEDPETIISEMLDGVRDRTSVDVVLDREEALRAAVASARAGDVVIALGKGHETYQAVRGENHDFPERRILARIAAERDGAES
ncbi:MAG: UDP-N-acetylmuramoyl-L-alanyl-D-glutamate--2,6-diaminopimelate ligase, partial [Gemmatimonadetes bacterium]|nr:UDP-N-acetylmuramoyl-L-alanyl-D-glutamate--2,6-diaminopimelate ligase [Gemmatimonadota bacterium]